MLKFIVLSSDQVKTTSSSEIYNAVKFERVLSSFRNLSLAYIV